MAALSRRSSPRIDLEAPIKYATKETGCFYDSTILNGSHGGVYFEPEIPIEPDSRIDIIMVNYSPGAYGPAAYRTYRARIAWCREIEREISPRFGVGAEFLARSHEIIHDNLEGLNRECILCGDMAPLNAIHKTEDGASLCGSCHKHMDAMPRGNTKEIIKGFIKRNRK